MGAISSAVFAARNVDKIGHGDIGRTPIPIVQAYNSIYDVAKAKAGNISKSANALLDKVDDAGRVFGVSNAATKVSSVASKAVNPLLCAASGVRILKDDDQYSALIEEGCAMGAMFGGERIFKYARNQVTDAIKKGDVGDLINNKSTKDFCNNLLKKIKGMSKGQKTALFVAGELLFVAASVLAFDTGKKIGKKITGRDKDNNPFAQKATGQN